MTPDLKALLEMVEKYNLRRFFKISKSGCWLYQMYLTPRGYGRINVDKKCHFAHRYFYQTLVGEIPKGLVIDHICRVRRCVNPQHLRVVTLFDNIMCGVGFGAKNARKKRCLRGHKFRDVTWAAKKKKRYCIACDRVWRRNYYRRLAAEKRAAA